MLKKLNNKKGFTLMEMLIVVAIIAVLVAISIPVFNGALTKSKEAADVANIRALYAEWQVGILTENKTIPADKDKFLAGPDNNGTTEFTFNYADTKLTYTNGKIEYAATKLTDANGSKTYTWTLHVIRMPSSWLCRGGDTRNDTKEPVPMLYTAPAITIYSCFIAALLGACMGSFLNCAAWRIVHGESVLRGRSHCDVCGHVLAPRDLVPVFSYVFSHGRCRYCGAKLSPRHAVGEAVAALVFVSLLLRYDISLRTLEAWAVACLLLACAFADLEGYIIPDRFIAVGVVLFIVTLFFVPDPGKRALDGLIGGVAVGGGVLLLALLMEKLLRRDAMGGGDIKLLFLTGLFLGWQKNLLCLLLACVVGILWGLVRAKRGQQGLPWGPGIALAAWCAALFGQNLIDWYLSLL